jgi:prevent-host-death family protein
MRERTIREAKNSLAALIHVAEKGEAVRLIRHGKPVALLVSECIRGDA